jgi:hypothetical protein
MSLETKFDVLTDGRAKDCDGILNFKRTRETMTYSKLCETIGGLVLGAGSVTLTRDGPETWIVSHTKTEEGFHEEEIWYCELGTDES